MAIPYHQEEAGMNTSEFVMHKGRKILIMDASGSSDFAANVRILEETEKMILTEPPKSVLLLTNVSGAYYNHAVVERFKKFSKNIGPNIRASTVVGVEGIKIIILQTIIFLTRRKIEMHATVEEAKDWLALQ